VRFISASGGAKGRPGITCTPSVNPCARLASRRQCSTSISHFTDTVVLRANRGQLFGAHDTRRRDSESKFSNNFWDYTHGPPLPEGLPHHTHPYDQRPCAGRKHPSAGTEPRPSYPLRSYGAPLVLQQEQAPGAATPLISARQHYADRTIVCYRPSAVRLSHGWIS